MKMNSLIDFKKFDKMNYHIAKDINKLIYDFSIDYPLNIFPKIVKYLRENITCKTHLDYKDKTGSTSIITILIDIDGTKVEFSITCVYITPYCNFNQCMTEELFLIYNDYQKFINNISPLERVLGCSGSNYGISTQGAHQIWSNLTKIFNKLYKFNETDRINFQNFIDNNIYEIVDYRYN